MQPGVLSIQGTHSTADFLLVVMVGPALWAGITPGGHEEQSVQLNPSWLLATVTDSVT